MNLAIVGLNRADGVSHAVLAFGIDLLDAPAQLWVEENSVLIVQIVLVYFSDHVTASNQCALLEICEGAELVKAVLIEARQVDTARHEHTFG